jgi:type IV secretory pathway protease TraF
LAFPFETHITYNNLPSTTVQAYDSQPIGLVLITVVGTMVAVTSRPTLQLWRGVLVTTQHCLKMLTACKHGNVSRKENDIVLCQGPRP